MDLDRVDPRYNDLRYNDIPNINMDLSARPMLQ